MDISTIVGLLVSIGGIIAEYLIDQGKMSALTQISPFLVVVVGTIGVVITSFGLGDVISAFKALFASYSKKNKPDPDALIKKICELADLCRSQGLLQLQSKMNDADLNSENYLMLNEAMVLATDTKTPKPCRTRCRPILQVIRRKSSLKSISLQKRAATRLPSASSAQSWASCRCFPP